MHAMLRKMAPQPLDALQVRREAMLHDQIASKAQHVRRIKERLFFCRDKELLRRPLRAAFRTPIWTPRGSPGW